MDPSLGQTVDKVILVNVELLGERGQTKHLLARLCQPVNFRWKY